MAEKIHFHPDMVFAEVARALQNQFPGEKGAMLCKDVERWKSALNSIASWTEGPVVTSAFDDPSSARLARAALTDMCQSSITAPTGGIPASVPVQCELHRNHYTPHQRETYKWPL